MSVKRTTGGIKYDTKVRSSGGSSRTITPTKKQGSGSAKLAAHREATSNQRPMETPEQYRQKVESSKQVTDVPPVAQAGSTPQSSTDVSPMAQSGISKSSNAPKSSDPIRPMTSAEIQQSQSVPTPIAPRDTSQSMPGHLSSTPTASKSTDPYSTPAAKDVGVTGDKRSIIYDYQDVQRGVSGKIPTYEAIISRRDELESTYAPDLHKNMGRVRSKVNEPGTAPSAFISFGRGVYSGVQEKPLDTALMVGAGYVGGAVIGGVTKAGGAVIGGSATATKVASTISNTPVIGTVGKFVLPGVLTAVATKDVYNRVTSPMLKVIDGEVVETKPTSEVKAERLGRITSTEIIPFTLGAGAWELRRPPKVTTEIKPSGQKEVEVLTGFEKIGEKNVLKTDKVVVPSSSVTAAEEAAANKLTRKLTADVRSMEVTGTQTISSPIYSTEVTITKETAIRATGQRTLSSDPLINNEVLSVQQTGKVAIDVENIVVPTRKETTLFTSIGEYKPGYNLMGKYEPRSYKNPYESDLTETFIRGKFTGVTEPAPVPVMSGSTGKLKITDGKIAEGKWQQSDIDEFASSRQKYEFAAESGTYGPDEYILQRGSRQAIKADDISTSRIGEGIDNIGVTIEQGRLDKSISKYVSERNALKTEPLPDAFDIDAVKAFGRKNTPDVPKAMDTDIVDAVQSSGKRNLPYQKEIPMEQEYILRRGGQRGFVEEQIVGIRDVPDIITVKTEPKSFSSFIQSVSPIGAMSTSYEFANMVGAGQRDINKELQREFTVYGVRDITQEIQSEKQDDRIITGVRQRQYTSPIQELAPIEPVPDAVPPHRPRRTGDVMKLPPELPLPTFDINKRARELIPGTTKKGKGRYIDYDINSVLRKL